MHFRHRNSCLQTHRQRQIILRQLRLHFRPCLLQLFQLLLCFLRLCLAQRRRFKIFLIRHLRHFLFGFFELHFQLLILAPIFLVRRNLTNRRRLVNHINHLIRHKSVINIPPRHINRHLQHLIRNLHPVMLLVMLLHTFQNLQRHLRARLLDHYRLESPTQGLILLDMFPIFIHRRRTNQLNLPPRQRWLQNIRCVHRPFSSSRPHQKVQLINEQNHIFIFNRFVNHSLNSLFKLPPKLRPRHHRTQVYLDNPLPD